MILDSIITSAVNLLATAPARQQAKRSAYVENVSASQLAQSEQDKAAQKQKTQLLASIVAEQTKAAAAQKQKNVRTVIIATSGVVAVLLVGFIYLKKKGKI